MLLSLLILLTGFIAVTTAHVQLQFPPARGPFNASQEPLFCGMSSVRDILVRRTDASSRRLFELQLESHSLPTHWRIYLTHHCSSDMETFVFYPFIA